MPRIRLERGELDGLDLHYTSAGHGPPTLLIHGLGGFAESWRETTAALEPETRVIAVDLPGFGRSAKPRRAYTLRFFAQAVEGLLDALEVERVRLVGHSLGGAVALTFALASPERVERVALLAAAVPGFPLRPSLVFRAIAWPGLGELFSRLVTPGMCRSALRRCFVVPRPEEVEFLVRYGYAVRMTPEGRAAYLATLRGVGADFRAPAWTDRAMLRGWNGATLIIHGRQDPVVPLAHAEAVVRGLRHAEVRWLDRCGHFPQIEHGAAVNGWLGEFLLAGAAGR